MESKVITRHLNRLLLDPNNYRFIDHPDYKKIEDDQVADARIQQRTYNLLVGKFNENIVDLISSFKKNGSGECSGEDGWLISEEWMSSSRQLGIQRAC